MFGRNTGLMDIPAFKINSRDWPKAWYLPNGVMLMMGWIRTKFTSLEQKREIRNVRMFLLQWLIKFCLICYVIL